MKIAFSYIFFALSSLCFGQEDTLVIESHSFDQIFTEQQPKNSLYRFIPNQYEITYLSSDSSTFSGVLKICLTYLGKYTVEDDEKCITKRYLNYKEGQLIESKETNFYYSSDFISTEQPSSQVHSYFELGSFKKGVSRSYYRTGELSYYEKTELKNDSLYSTSIGFQKNGTILLFGNSINGAREGKWESFTYNDTIPIIEVYKFDNLIDVISDRVIYIGKNNEVIDKKAFFNILEDQDYSWWNIHPLNQSEINLTTGQAFIMYSEKLINNIYSQKVRKKIIKQYITKPKPH